MPGWRTCWSKDHAALTRNAGMPLCLQKLESTELFLLQGVCPRSVFALLTSLPGSSSLPGKQGTPQIPVWFNFTPLKEEL